MAVRFTEPAMAALKRLARHFNTTSIRFGVAGGGCNGYKYILEPLDDPDDKATYLQIDDITVEVCRLSEVHVFGTVIDWEESIMGARFVFHNPNAASNCGCGATFSTE